MFERGGDPKAAKHEAPGAVERKCRFRLTRPRHNRTSELDEWDCVDELVDEEAWSQEVVA